MKLYKNALVATSIFLILCFQALHAQKASQRELTIFRKGISDYQNGVYNKAVENFKLVISKLPNSPLLTANYLMLAKTQYKQGQYSQSLQVCGEFIDKFPQSKYRDDIYNLMGNNYYRLERYATAVGFWIRAAEFSTDPGLEKIALTNVEGMIRFHLDEGDLNLIKGEANSVFAKQVVHYNIGQRYYLNGNRSQAIIELDILLNSTDPDTYHYNRAVKLKAKIENRPLEGGIRISALLPLSGANQDVGTALLDGVKLAVKDFNAINDTKIDLVVHDYETRLVTAVEKFKAIAKDETVIAVYGPVENDIVAACAAISDYEELPMFSPTARGEGLTSLSPYFVQLATPVDVRGEILAAFAMDSLKLKRVVTLAPIEDYFTAMIDAFSRTAQNSELEISSKQWYYPGDQDFKQQFKALKRLGLKLSFADSLIMADSTILSVTIDSLYNAYMKEAQLLLKETSMEVDSADIPVTAFDGIFLPIYRDDISAMAPNFAYWNIQAQPLGNEDWYDVKELKKNKNYLRDLIFLSDGYLNEDSWDYRQFRNRFRLELNKTPEQYEFIGFDSFSFILSTIDNEDLSLDRRELLRKVQAQSLYRGIYCNYRIGSKRYNNAPRLLKYLYGQIVPLN